METHSHCLVPQLIKKCRQSTSVISWKCWYSIYSNTSYTATREVAYLNECNPLLATFQSTCSPKRNSQEHRAILLKHLQHQCTTASFWLLFGVVRLRKSTFRFMRLGHKIDFVTPGQNVKWYKLVWRALTGSTNCMIQQKM